MITPESVTWVQVIFFAITTIPVLYILYRHGKHGLLGWLFFEAFCILRVVGGAILLHAELNGQISETGAIISQVGLSPLFLSLFGIAQEAASSAREKHPILLNRVAQEILAHALVIPGLALTIVGSTAYASRDATPSERDDSLVKLRVGVCLFLVAWVLLCFIVLLTMVTLRRMSAKANERALLLGLGCCLPLLLLRTLYSVLGAFINSESWSFLTGGTLAEKAVMSVLSEFLIAIILVIVGFLSRNIGQDRKELRKATAQPTYAGFEDHQKQGLEV